MLEELGTEAGGDDAAQPEDPRLLQGVRGAGTGGVTPTVPCSGWGWEFSEEPWGGEGGRSKAAQAGGMAGPPRAAVTSSP